MELLSQLHTIPKTKTILIRCDFNVPLSSSSEVLDDTRITSSVKTIKKWARSNKVILCSHLGRPSGKFEEKTSLIHIKPSLEHHLGQKVCFISSIEKAKQTISKSSDQIFLLENVRFYRGEEANAQSFAKKLADLADLYVNDAFSVSHRSHASVEKITQFLPSYAGDLFSQEYQYLQMLVTKPRRPFVTIVGGAKISTKVNVVKTLAQIADVVLVGGGVANHFIKSQGFDTAASYIEESHEDPISIAGEIIDTTKHQRMLLHGYIPLPKILYPIDVVASDDIDHPKTIQELMISDTELANHHKKLSFLDIGSKTQQLYAHIISQAETIFWNGPMGLVEKAAFADGTRKIASAIAKSPATTVVGGGDSIAAINAFGLGNRYDYVSASGGAALEFISGNTLPGLSPLLKQKVVTK